MKVLVKNSKVLTVSGKAIKAKEDGVVTSSSVTARLVDKYYVSSSISGISVTASSSVTTEA